MDITAFYIDKYPVTNLKYKIFLEKSNYIPIDTSNFLKNWNKKISNNKIIYNYPENSSKKPVTFVSVEGFI
jgi:formylglycine-generating enzyme required for sulfatase activity